MNTKKIIMIQFNEIHDQSGWFVSMNDALKGVKENDALWKPHEDSNSIWGIVNHLLYYNQGYLNRFKEEGGTKFEINTNSESFQNLEGFTWEEALSKLDNVMEEFKVVIKESNENMFHTNSEDLLHLTIHNAYHIGQIVHIRKHQGSWNDGAGVD